MARDILKLVPLTLELAVALSIGAIQFSFLPQNATLINETVVYKCSVIGDGVTIQWTVNGYSSTSSIITNQNIVTEGVGTMNSKLTIPGDPTLNGTTVTCIGSGVVNGKHYINSSSAILYIQGPPSSPDITCFEVGKYNVKCNWTVPYTISGIEIERYEYKITIGKEIILQEKVNSTEVKYVKGNYSLSVAAIIGRLMGQTNTTSIMSDTDILCNYSFTYEIQNLNSKWMASIGVANTDIEQFSEVYPRRMSVMACQIDSSQNCNYNTTDIEKHKGLKLMNDITIELKENEEWNITVFVNYDSRLNVISNHYSIIRTFDVQKLRITDSDTNGKVCFSCSYVKGSSALGCFILYMSMHFNCSLYIPKTEHVQCVNDFITGEYNISVYDHESDGTVFTNTPAVHTSTRIEGMSVTTSSYGSSYSSSYSSPFSPSASSSTIPKPSRMTVNVVAISSATGGMMAVILLVTAIVVLLTYIIRRARHHRKPVDCHTELEDHSIQCANKNVQMANQQNYLETVISPAGPKVPLSSANKNFYPYSDIYHGMPPIQSHVSCVFDQMNDSPISSTRSDNIYNRLHENTEQAKGNIGKNQSDYSTIQKRGDNEYTVGLSEVTDTPDSILKYTFVISLVFPISHKWEQFGRLLAITPKKLNEIRENHPHEDYRAFCDVVQEWKTSKIRPFTTKTLRMVLDRIGESELLMS